MKITGILVTMMTVCLFASCGGSSGASVDEEANKETVRKMVSIINSRDYDKLNEVMTEDMVRHSDATPDVNVKSLEDMKSFLRSDNEAFPDSVVSIEQLIAEDDIVAGRFVYEGTQKGALGPFPASGKRVKGPFISFLRLENGKIAEMWVEWDNVSMLSQLGHFPPKSNDRKQEGPTDGPPESPSPE